MNEPVVIVNTGASVGAITCKWCKKRLAHDESHNCPNWLDMVHDSEIRYQAERAKRGIPDDGWRGD